MDFRITKFPLKRTLPILFFLCFTQTYLLAQSGKSPIDREALVRRNNPKLTQIDTLGSLTVGNGTFAFTVDASGLQSFPAYYENGISLGTQSEWGWHSFPNPDEYVLEDVLKNYKTCNGHRYPIAIQRKRGRAHKATEWLRQNPHRLHLGLIGLVFYDKTGQELDHSALKDVAQELDMWTGAITSNYTVDGSPVAVTLYAHPNQDLISVQIKSKLVETGQLKVRMRFPNGKRCHVCPGYDFDDPTGHSTKVLTSAENTLRLARTLDETYFQVAAKSNIAGDWQAQTAHDFVLQTNGQTDLLELSVRFEGQHDNTSVPSFQQTKDASIKAWRTYWETGAAVDFSACTDSRAPELERRVVLSQYLTRVQCTGQYPPQETGLTMNSWYGKFHLEMHWWHGVHFALWNRLHLLEESLAWYKEAIPEARATAQRQGFAGVRWQKMTTPEAKSSPSSVGEFLIWQQPHPIYFAELVYRQKPSKEILNEYKEIIFESAAFMADFAQLKADGYYHLCAPIIPAQEIFHATKTSDPAYELAYWRFALNVAQEWRLRLGMKADPQWQEVIDKLAPIPTQEGLYLPCAGAEEAYSDRKNRRDHPIVTGALGMLPSGPHLDEQMMSTTFDEIMRDWQWDTTWGWDYPMLAMSAARLGKPEQAIEALFLDAAKNTYLVNGHNYQGKRLRLYLPGNGGLLTAVAMMAAGWDNGPEIDTPGFPKDGTWDVRWEGLQKMP